VGEPNTIRPLWRHFFLGTDGVIFIVDSNDPNRMQIAAKELHGLLAHDELRDAIVLVLATKQEQPNAIAPSHMCDKLSLQSIHNPWHIQPCTATTEDGINEGLEWLLDTLANRGCDARRIKNGNQIHHISQIDITHRVN